MRNPLFLSRWNPYIVGAGIGMLSWATFLFMDQALGTSTSMVGAAAAIERLFSEQRVAENAYFAKHYVGPDGFRPIVDWQMALVVMLGVGAFLSAWLGRTLRAETVPALWASRFGPSPAKRLGVAFLGGAVLIVGARMAGGCTSGHGISGGLQLAVGSWTFFVAMFVSGVATAMLMFRPWEARERQEAGRA